MPDVRTRHLTLTATLKTAISPTSQPENLLKAVKCDVISIKVTILDRYILFKTITGWMSDQFPVQSRQIAILPETGSVHFFFPTVTLCLLYIAESMTELCKRFLSLFYILPVLGESEHSFIRFGLLSEGNRCLTA